MPPAEAPTPLCVEEITSLAGLEALRPEWGALWARVPDATPFQSPDWLIPWWRHIGEGALLTLALRLEAGGLAGLVPLYIHTGADRQRLLFPLGIATTDYLDALIMPEHRATAMAAIFEHLARRHACWDACEWPQLRPGSALLEAAAPAGWLDEIGEAEPCPVLRLPRDPALLAETVPTETLASLGHRRKRAARKGTLRFERAGAQDAEALLEAHLRLHGARWEARGEAGVLAARAVQAVHRESLPGLLRNGTLRLYALRIDERIVATLQVLADPPGRADRRVYFYLGGFDPAFERLSPGMLIVGHAIEDSVREGATAVDFLRGREAHKYRWGAVDTPTWRRHLRPPPLRGAGGGG